MVRCCVYIICVFVTVILCTYVPTWLDGFIADSTDRVYIICVFVAVILCTYVPTCICYSDIVFICTHMVRWVLS